MKGLNVEANMKSYGYFPKSENNIDIILLLFYAAEDTIIQIVKSSSQDSTERNMYEVEITP